MTSAFSAAGPTVAGTEPADKKKRTRKSGPGAPAVAPPPTFRYANGRDCGGGIHAGPNTSCVFAARVRDAYDEAPGSTASVRVYSPLMRQTYTMHCALSGSVTTCSGGNNASVTF